MRPIDADALLEKLKNLEASGGSNAYRKALNDALHYFFPKIIGEIPTITPPPNAPLTLKELREMEGEPVWVEFSKCPEASGWMLISAIRYCVYDGMLGDCDFVNCGKTWLAYRRKPEEV